MEYITTSESFYEAVIQLLRCLVFKYCWFEKW